LAFVFLVSGGVVFLLLSVAALISNREGEPVAQQRFLPLAVLLSAPYFLIGWLFEIPPQILFWLFIILPLIFFLYLILPIDPAAKKIEVSPPPNYRHDERDIMFSRQRLQPGTNRFDEYYQTHPEKKALDDAWRAKPGLLNPKAQFYHPLYFNASDASFDTVAFFHPHVQPQTASEKQEVQAEQVSRFIKDWLLRSGAHSVGITRLQDYHLYSHRGRQEPYGAEIQKEHEFAIAFTVEMNKEMVDSAPLAPTVLESADQYLRAGMLAVKLSTFISKLGYEARAHIDGNYQVICPLVARDAGLGELGRMGLLMTPALGPRVRIGVVTTNLPLQTDDYQPDNSVIDFCNKCKKCAYNCPSKAISFEDRQWEHGVLRWKIDPEACFGYWCAVGTDCARCMKVCPYSHPDNLMHRLVRKTIRKNSMARWLAIKMDDVIYGKHPPARRDLL